MTWTPILAIIPITNSLKREFYVQMCIHERWSVRTFRERINSMLYKRTAISKKPEQTIINDLEWTNVMISKTLHFMTRASRFIKNPPVPIDGAVILKTVWPFLTNSIAEASKDWSNGLAGYRRYMTFTNYFASKLGWTTTQFENTLFHQFG